ncbi:MAG: baseplate J/gp47 family protein [Pseudomonadota bacterium]
MAWVRQTLPTTISRLLANAKSRLAGTDPWLRRSIIGEFLRAIAGAVHGLHGHLDYNAQQTCPATMDEENFTRYAAWKGIPRLDAVAATGSVTLAGSAGAVVEAGTVLQSGDGARYATDAEATITGSTVDVDVTAEAAGAAGNQDAGVTLSLVSPVPGVQSAAVVAAGGLAGGADVETLERWKARVQAWDQAPAEGGSARDFMRWAFDAHPDVTRVWVTSGAMGDTAVTIRAMTDDATGDGVPTQAALDAIDAYITEVDASGNVFRRPVDTILYVVAPIADAFTPTISLSPNTQAVRDAVSAELADLFRREAEPEDGSGNGRIPLTHIREAISRAAGEFDHSIDQATDLTYAVGHIGVLGAITFQEMA